MKAKIEEREPLLVVGAEIRTNNETEMSGKGKIPALWMRVRSEKILDAVPHAAEAGTMLAVYSSYENREKGDYSFLIGVPVTRVDGSLSPGLVSHSIPRARVARLETEVGSLPDIVIDLWKKIWKMPPAELGGSRAFTFDIERYDSRVKDEKRAQVEITLAVE